LTVKAHTGCCRGETGAMVYRERRWVVFMRTRKCQENAMR